MKLLTKNTDYAVRALIYLGLRPNCFVSSREIALAQNIPLPYNRRILQVLKKKDILLSKEGFGGGVKLKGSPRKIKLVDVVNLFQGNVGLLECMFRKQICGSKATCVLRKRIKRIEDNVVGELEKITILDLIEDLK